jgi:hypothetical protein
MVGEVEGYSWSRSANEIRVNGMQIFLEREKGSSTLLTDQDIKKLESSYYKAAADKNINTEAKANDVTEAEKVNILAREKLTVRHSFRLWLDKVTEVELKNLTQVEEVQRKDLIQSPCSKSCASNSTYCATCGYNFAEKYKVLRDQKKYKNAGEDEDAEANLNKTVEKSYSDVGITNNERMVMCACYKGVGPYSDSENGFQSVRELAADYLILSVLYGALVNSSLFSWFVATTFCIALLFSKNSAAVSTDYAADQKYYFMDQITVLNKRNQNIQKKYNRLRMNIEG